MPVLTPAGCWAIIFSYPLDDLPGKALGTPYWQRAEVQRAFLIYLCLAILTLVVFLVIRRSVRRFARLARVMRLRGKPTAGFAANAWSLCGALCRRTTSAAGGRRR